MIVETHDNICVKLLSFMNLNFLFFVDFLKCASIKFGGLLNNFVLLHEIAFDSRCYVF